MLVVMITSSFNFEMNGQYKHHQYNTQKTVNISWLFFYCLQNYCYILWGVNVLSMWKCFGAKFPYGTSVYIPNICQFVF